MLVLLLISLITACKSTQAQERNLPRQVSTNDGSFELFDQGQLRSFYLHTPKSYNPNRQMPLVLVFHGSYGSGNSIANVTRFNDLAEQKGFIVVYPNGINHQWSYGSGLFSLGVNDISFVASLIDYLKQKRNIDSRRIYATGFSSGGFLAQILACNLSTRIAAVASVAASLPANLASSCKPKSPVSVLMINGTGDRAVPYTGGKIGGVGREVVSVPKTIALWRQNNSCASKATLKPLLNTEIYRYSHCRGGAEVELVSVKRGGHRWPGGASGNVTIQSNDNSEINASQAIWDFFRRHTLT